VRKLVATAGPRLAENGGEERSVDASGCGDAEHDAEVTMVHL
jgi:hypothetical protein